jgi:putative Holliday junction resolvase
MPIIFGIDYGIKRIGIAISDADETIALAGRMLNSCGDPKRDAETVLAEAKDYAARRFVVGLPINMDNTEGPQAELTRRFANALKKASGNMPVEYFDERLSSAAADWSLDQMELTKAKRKARRDIISAQVILQGWLDARRAKRPQPPAEPEGTQLQ